MIVSAGAGVNLEVIAEGRGPLMVLVPSFARGSEDFDAVAAGLSGAGMRVLRPQPRGTGRSAGPMTGLSFVFATIAAMLFLGEHPSTVRWAGVVLIVIGAGLIVGSVAVVISAQQLAPKTRQPIAAGSEAVDCAT